MLRRTFLPLLLAFAAILGPATLLAQIGSSTDVIVGSVVGPDALPLAAAHVDVTSVESGITRKQLTGEDGRYSVIFPDGGGRYVITVHYLGMAPIRTLLARRADEDRLVANFTLTASAIRLSAVMVEAQRIADSLRAGAGATGQVLSRELLDQLGYQGNEAAALALITPGVSLMQGGDSSFNAISIGGQSASQTGHLIDGLAAGSASLPREAVKSTNIMTSAYDVSTGQYSGGFIEQSTVSGTNNFRGSLNSSMPLAPIGSLSNQGVLNQTRTGIDAGGNLAGPFIKDHLFGSLAAHFGQNRFPGASVYSLPPNALARIGIVPDSVSRFLNILDANGITRPAGDVSGVRSFGNRQVFGRMDFTPSERHTLTISANEYGYWSRGWFSGPLSTPTAGGEYSTEAWRAQMSLTSHLGAWVNDARVSASAQRYGATARLVASSGRVILPSSQNTSVGSTGVSTLTFGGSPFAAQLTKTGTVDTKDELSWLSSGGSHRAKIGVSLTLGHGTGGVAGNTLGTYTFNSLADLQNANPVSYTRTLAPTNQFSATVDAGMYAGDAWRMGPQLQLVYGFRLEHSMFRNPPELNQAAESVFGIHTNVFPNETRLSPRLGFTYSPGATGKKQATVTIRGGVGLFRSGAASSASTFAAARDATGLADSQLQLNCVGAAVPALDWAYFTTTATDLPASCASGIPIQAVSALPKVVVVDPSFHLPRTLRASLEASRDVAKNWNVSVSTSLTSGYAGQSTNDLNLVASPRFRLADEGNRPVFVLPGAIVPATGAISFSDSRANPVFGVVSLVTSSLRNVDRSVDLSIARNSAKFNINMSYSYTYSRMQVRGGSDVSQFFGSIGSVAGDPRAVQWIRTPWTTPHQIRVFASYRPKAWLEFTPSMFAIGRDTYEPVVGGDVNGDGSSNDRAFVFDPAHTSDTAVANGMTRLLASASPRTRNCLESQLGKLAAADSCGGPWYVSGGLSLKVTPPWNGGRLTLRLQTNNAPAGLDLLLHGSGKLHNWGQYPNTNATLLYVRGFDPVSQTFRYAVDERFGTSTPRQTFYRQPMQMTLVAQLALGRMGGQMGAPLGAMGMMGPSGAGVASGTGVAHGDALRTKLAATVPNVFRRVAALKDSLSLSLDATQLARLKVFGDAYQPRADSLVNDIVSVMSAPVAGTDPATIASRLRTKTNEATALRRKAIEDLGGVLTEDQMKKLPASLTDIKQ